MTKSARDLRWPLAVALLAALAALAAGCGAGTEAGQDTEAVQDDPAVARAKEFVEEASASQTEWNGPTESPKAQPGKSVVYITLDAQIPLLIEGGIEEAAEALGWNLTMLDGKGNPDTQRDAILQAIALGPDGIILGSIDAQLHAEPIRQAVEQGIVVVGWHSVSEPGPVEDPPIFADVQAGTSDDYGAVLGNFAIAATDGTARAVIITDHAYEIAQVRAEAMQSTIEECKGCEVVEYLNSPIAEATERFQQVTTALLQRHGTPLVLLAVNDFYHDFAVPALRTANVPNDEVKLIGIDGNDNAFARIRNGNEWEIGTVTEPIVMLGWQTLDELNRAFAGEEWSGFIPNPQIINTENIDRDITDEGYYEPQFDYREEYRKLWGID